MDERTEHLLNEVVKAESTEELDLIKAKLEVIKGHDNAPER